METTFTFWFYTLALKYSKEMLGGAQNKYFQNKKEQSCFNIVNCSMYINCFIS